MPEFVFRVTQRDRGTEDFDFVEFVLTGVNHNTGSVLRALVLSLLGLAPPQIGVADDKAGNRTKIISQYQRSYSWLN